MKIENNIIKYYLKNVLFITGTAYAGKSTMVAMLAERYGLVHCGENYHLKFPNELLIQERQPNLCYFQTMKNWQEFLHRTPEEYEEWIYEGAREAAEIEVAELIHISQNKRVIVDTNIPLSILHEIADYRQVAVMLSLQTMSVNNFFHRDDPDKVFIREQILNSEDPDSTMENYKACIAAINSKEHYDEYANSGFFTLVREDILTDTKEITLEKLAKHFNLNINNR